MEIREITGDKRRYLPLLLVGDEQEEMVMRYLCLLYTSDAADE